MPENVSIVGNYPSRLEDLFLSPTFVINSQLDFLILSSLR